MKTEHSRVKGRVSVFLLGVIFLMALAVRVMWLDRWPVGFNADEASQGYTAFSLLKTARDEWGKFLPITPRSFGDFRDPLYSYLTIPSVAIFGLNIFATRLPGAVFGALSVVGLYLLVSTIFKGKTVGDFTVDEEAVGLVAAALLAFSPWHIQLSRGAFEANLATFFLPFGWWAFEKGLKTRGFMVLAAALFGLGPFSYYSVRAVVPFFVLSLVVLRRSVFRVWGVRRGLGRYWLALGVLAVFMIATTWTSFFGGTRRAADVAIFSPTGGWQTVYSIRYEGALLGEPAAIGTLFWNKLTYVWSLFVANYLSYFSPQFLFTQGAGEATYGMVPGIGLLYLPELVFMACAVFVMVKNHLGRLHPYNMLLVALVLAPIPAALAKGPGFAANRAAIMLPYLEVFSAFGVVVLWGEWKKRMSGQWIAVVSGLVMVVSVATFMERYVYHGPMATAKNMVYGWGEVAKYLESNSGRYSSVIVSRSFGEPQIFVGFYLKVDPSFFQAQSSDWMRYRKQGLKFVDQLGEYSLGKYKFETIDYKKEAEVKGVLLVGRGEELPVDKNLLKEIDYPDGSPAIRISRSGGQLSV